MLNVSLAGKNGYASFWDNENRARSGRSGKRRRRKFRRRRKYEEKEIGGEGNMRRRK
jgi:hypothetical protein